MYPADHPRRARVEAEIVRRIECLLEKKDSAKGRKVVYAITGKVPVIRDKNLIKDPVGRVPVSPHTVAFLKEVSGEKVIDPRASAHSLVDVMDRSQKLHTLKKECCRGCRERIVHELGQMAEAALMEQIRVTEVKISKLIDKKVLPVTQISRIMDKLETAVNKAARVCKQKDTPERVEALFMAYVALNNDLLHLLTENELRFGGSQYSGDFL